MVMFNLCDPGMADGCLVQGELTAGPVAPGRDTASLDDYLESAAGRHEGTMPSPRKTELGQFRAVEAYSQGRASHGPAVFSIGGFVIETPAGFYSCQLMARPEQFETLLDQWRTFCASLNVSPGAPD